MVSSVIVFNELFNIGNVKKCVKNADKFSYGVLVRLKHSILNDIKHREAHFNI